MNILIIFFLFCVDFKEIKILNLGEGVTVFEVFKEILRKFFFLQFLIYGNYLE